MPTLLRSRTLWIFLLIVGLIRLITLSVYPLMDTTEARYGEMARMMVETGNWIMLQFDYGVPFWGKPPLSFWASALSISAFTNSEFFLRLPHVLAAVAVLALLWQFALALNFSRRQADITVAVVATTVGFLVSAGLVMTDMYLCLAMTITMIGFWRGWHGESAWAYVMWAGLGIGLLAKGPLIIVLVGIALFPWLAIDRGLLGMWKPVWQRLRLPSGILLMLLIALPWYLLAERESPGFLEYFIVGEHFQRFLVSGWEGDLYGSAHHEARGMIWGFWLVFTLPWSPLLLFAAARGVIRQRSIIPGDRLVLFMLLWMCSPMLLFTMAGNILPAYVLPGMPAVGLLILKSMNSESAGKTRYLLLFGPVILLLASTYAGLVATNERSDRDLLAEGVDSEDALYYYEQRPYSAQYYSNGRAIRVVEFPTDERFYLAIQHKRKHKLPHIDKSCKLRAENQDRLLYFCQQDPPA
jgi:4-amino-4-deoxy-L-arabinose transferase-like glycosyltransferase